MKHRILDSLGRFFEGTGWVLSTPSGDARGHLRVPINSAQEMDDSAHFMGR